MPEYTRIKTAYLLLAAGIIIAIAVILAVTLLAGPSDPLQPPESPENTTKITAAPGTVILVRPGADGVNYSATLNGSGYSISDTDIANHLWNKVTEYNRSICDYGVNETGYLTIFLETYYSPEEPEKTLAEIDKISAAKKIPLLPVRFIIAELDYQVKLADELWHNASVTEERLAEILRNITATT
ncbi:MAG: hypothetical protein O0V67_08295 [Methanocorpusculum sp.]|nr:hypothetical protein [Methanocorpusculum sp.]